MDHWSDNFEHTSITDENRGEFATAMGKYENANDAVVGGFNAQKLAGKPFKFPESMDKLPDDASRTDFTSKAKGLLGIKTAKDVAELAELNMKMDIAEGSEPDENLTTMLKSFVVENEIDTGVAQKFVGFHNRIMKAAKEQFATAEEEKKTQAATATNEALIAHFKTEAEVAKQSELMRRAFQNKAGLNAEEFEKVGDALADSVFTKNPILARAILTLVSPLAAEGTTDGGGGGGGGGDPPKDPDEGSPTYKALGWDKSDK